MPKPFLLHITRSAKADLKEIEKYTLEHWSEAMLHRYRAKLEASFKALTLKPNIGAKRNDIEPGIRAKLSGKHKIIYTFDSNQIYIKRIIHSSRDIKRELDRTRDKGRGRGR